MPKDIRETEKKTTKVGGDNQKRTLGDNSQKSQQHRRNDKFVEGREREVTTRIKVTKTTSQ